MDEFGNSVYLEDNQFRVVRQDTAIKHNTQISTDLFYGRSIIGNIEISKSITLVGDSIIFYGQDEYFRCFNKNDGKKISPIEIDIRELIEIQKNYYVYKLPNREIETLIKKEFARYE